MATYCPIEAFQSRHRLLGLRLLRGRTTGYHYQVVSARATALAKCLLTGEVSDSMPMQVTRVTNLPRSLNPIATIQ